jgi:hypothetical protein
MEERGGRGIGGGQDGMGGKALRCGNQADPGQIGNARDRDLERDQIKVKIKKLQIAGQN